MRFFRPTGSNCHHDAAGGDRPPLPLRVIRAVREVAREPIEIDGDRDDLRDRREGSTCPASAIVLYPLRARDQERDLMHMCKRLHFYPLQVAYFFAFNC